MFIRLGHERIHYGHKTTESITIALVLRVKKKQQPYCVNEKKNMFTNCQCSLYLYTYCFNHKRRKTNSACLHIFADTTYSFQAAYKPLGRDQIVPR